MDSAVEGELSSGVVVAVPKLSGGLGARSNEQEDAVDNNRVIMIIEVEEADAEGDLDGKTTISHSAIGIPP